MKLTIVYDNEVYKKDMGLKSDWGFSCLIETTDETILFDTGAKGKILLHNMASLDIDPSSINKIAISHEHWDHKGGLKSLLPLIDDTEIYRLKKQNPDGKIRPVFVSTSCEITEGVYTTGRLKGVVDEQSLVLKGKIGWYVLVGCSHPGVERILNAAKQYGKIVGIIGGLHGFNDFPILKDLDIICPCHCTKYKKEIKELYPKTYVDGGVGKVIEI